MDHRYVEGGLNPLATMKISAESVRLPSGLNMRTEAKRVFNCSMMRVVDRPSHNLNRNVPSAFKKTAAKS